MRISSKLSHASVRLAYLAATAVGALMLFPAASAQAASVIVGSPLTASFTSVEMCSPLCTEIATALPEPGAHVTSPISGTIVRWHILDASDSAFKLRVLHPEGGDKYLGAGTSSAETPTSTGLQTFSADLPIQAGDAIGLDNMNTEGKLGFASPQAPRVAPFSRQLLKA